MNNELIAKVAHTVNKAYCETLGDYSQPSWDEAPEWQKASALQGVEFHLNDEVTPEQAHENWMKHKESEGWVYGEEKDVVLKTHSCMRPYKELPLALQHKDLLFKAVVSSFK